MSIDVSLVDKNVYRLGAYLERGRLQGARDSSYLHFFITNLIFFIYVSYHIFLFLCLHVVHPKRNFVHIKKFKPT